VAVFQSTTTEATADNAVVQLLLATQSANGLGIVNTSGSLLLPVGNYNVDYVVASANSTTGATFSTVSLALSGVNVMLGNQPQTTGGTFAGEDTGSTVSGSAFVQSNGASTLTLTVTNIYTGGAVTASGYLRITAM